MEQPIEEKKAYDKGAVLRPAKAIRAKCIDCCGGSFVEVNRCPCITCAIWPYRMGRRPTQEMIDKYTAAVGGAVFEEERDDEEEEDEDD